MSDFYPQALSNIVWAYAKTRQADPELFDAVEKTALLRLVDFEPQHIANTVWAYEEAGHPAPKLLEKCREVRSASRREGGARAPGE
jgi:hypothetical protein